MQNETPLDNGTTGPAPVAVPERRTQIKLTATPSRRAIPAVIAAATDESSETSPGQEAHDTNTPTNPGMFSDFSVLAEATGGDVIIALDRALRFTFANHAAETLFNRSSDAMRGRPIAALAPDANRESPLLSHLRDSLRSGTSSEFEMNFEETGQSYKVFLTPFAEGVFACLRPLPTPSTQQVQQTPQESEQDSRESQQLIEQMIEMAPDSIYIQDIASGSNVYRNANVARSLGYTPEELEAMSPAAIAALMVPEDRVRQLESRQKLHSDATIVEYEYRMIHKNTSIRWMRTRETVFGRDANGNPRLLLGFAQDITERRRMMEILAHREEYLRRLTESSPDCILTLDLNGGLVQINQAGKTLMQIADFAPLVGADWPMLFQENYRSTARRAIQVALSGGTERFQGVAKTAMGTPIWWDVVVNPIPGTDGKPAQILTVARDISNFKALEAERERLLQETITRADYDPLTGLLNHRAFHRRLQEVMHEAKPVAILVVDLENFRYFNEAYGRSAGDELLIRLAKELSGCCRDSDTIARVGPDEFSIITPDMRAEEVGPYILRLRAAVDSIGMRSPNGTDTIPLHIAVGYALFPSEAEHINSAYDLAEERRRNDQTGGHSREAERVRESLRETVDSFAMLDTLISTIDGKDRMTRRQSEDTLFYCRRIAEKFNLPDEQKRSLDIAALLHDVGKVGIDERILRQPGKLSGADFGVVQQHPKIGAMLVGSTVDDVDAVEAILYHHENWDGTGYPAGIVGEEIPLLARILNVAASYAAMINNRPYRKGMTPNAAKKVLQGGAGTQWDPECVTVLLSVAK